MQQLLDEMIAHMSVSHTQLARVLEAERHIAVRMAQVIHAMPDRHPDFGGMEGLMERSHNVGKNVVSYLNGIAELQEALAEHLAAVMKEMDAGSEE